MLFTLIVLLLGFPIFAFAVFISIYLFVARPYQIAGNAMSPHYRDGQYYLAKGATFATVNRGDVIVFQAPQKQGVDYLKRVIGLPGEKVMLKNGLVYVNNTPLDESAYLSKDTKTYGMTFLMEEKEVIVPEDEYFVLGDNRDFSSDSRDWGFVPKENIKGIMGICYFNCSK